jgi:hypothetical protein
MFAYENANTLYITDPDTSVTFITLREFSSHPSYVAENASYACSTSKTSVSLEKGRFKAYRVF